MLPVKKSTKKLPLYMNPVKAGFPSPATDMIDKKLDLNEYLINHPASTFFVTVSGDSMINAGIHTDDLLIIDRSLEVKNDDIVLAVVNSEFTVKRIKKSASALLLIPENPKYHPIKIKNEDEFEVWGVVVGVIKKFRK